MIEKIKKHLSETIGAGNYIVFEESEYVWNKKECINERKPCFVVVCNRNYSALVREARQSFGVNISICLLHNWKQAIRGTQR